MPTGSGAGGGAKDVRAGGAYVELYSRDNLSKTLDRLKGRFNALGSFIGKTGAVSLAAGAAILAPLTGLLSAGTANAAEIARLADQFNIPIEQMSRLKYAADESGESLEDVAKNQAKYAALLARAPVFDEREARQALETQRQLGEATSALQRAMLPFLSAILPVVRAVADWTKANAALVRPLALVGLGLSVAGVAMIGFAVGLKVSAAAVGGLMTALALLKAGLLAVVSLPGLIVVGLAAGVAAWVAWTESGRRFAADAADAFTGLRDTATTAWGGIVAAVAAGDLDLAGKVAVAGLKAAWAEGMNFLTKQWVEFKNAVVTGWADIRDVLANGIVFWQTAAIAAVDGKQAALAFAKGMYDQQDAMRKEEDRDRAGFRKAQIEAARMELEAAKDELRQLQEQAVKAAARGGIPDRGLQFVTGPIRSAFAGATLGQQLGVGDKFGEKQIQLLGGILAAANGQKQGIDDLNRNLRAK